MNGLCCIINTDVECRICNGKFCENCWVADKEHTLVFTDQISPYRCGNVRATMSCNVEGPYCILKLDDNNIGLIEVPKGTSLREIGNKQKRK